MSKDEDENHIIAGIVREMLSGNKYDTKNIPKRYIPKIQAVLKAAKQDAIARGQLPVVKQLQAILATLPETDIIYNGHTNSLLDRKNKKRTFQPTVQSRGKRTPQYLSKEPSINFDTPISNARLQRPKTALQYNNRNNTKQNLDNNRGDNDLENEIDENKSNRLVSTSPPTDKTQNNIKRQPKKRNYTDEQLDAALENMVSGNSFIPPTDVISELIDYSKRKIDFLIENGELISAQKYEDVYQQMQSSKLAWEECNAKSAKLNELVNHLNRTNKNLQSAEENMQIELNDYDERMNAIKEAQLQEYEEQLKEFDRETNFRILERNDDDISQSTISTSRNSTDQSFSQNNQENSENSLDQSNSENSKDSQNSINQSNTEISIFSKSSKNKSSSQISTSRSNKSTSNKPKIYPNLPPSFRKFSQRLLDLRQKEKLLLRTRRFEEAGYTRIEADKIEAVEIIQCKNNYIKSREDKKLKIIEDQNQKMKCFDENVARTRQRLKSENEIKITALKRAKENFQSRINRLDSEIKDVLSITPAHSPLDSRPLSTHRPPDQYQPQTFMTQNQQAFLKTEKNDINGDQKIKKKRSTTAMASPHIVYRPIPSKWRLQTPMVLKVQK